MTKQTNKQVDKSTHVEWKVATSRHSFPLFSQDPKLSILLYESLRAPAWLGFAGCCDVCFTHLSQLKREAIHMLLNQNRTIWPNSSPASVSPGYHALGSHTLPRAIGARSPSPNKRHKFSNPRTETWVREHSRFDTLWGANNEMAPFADTVGGSGLNPFNPLVSLQNAAYYVPHK